MQSQVEKITPEIAAEYLKANVGNRAIRRSKVRSYATMIKRGEWLLTDQGISFDVTGRLQNGQHRLSAVIVAGVPVDMYVTRGCDPRAFLVLDQGVKRDTADVFAIEKRVGDVLGFMSRLYFGSEATSAQKELLLPVVAPHIEALLDRCGSARKLLSSSPVKSAAVTSMIAYPQSREYILSLYRNFVLCNMDELPPIGLCLLKSQLTGKGPLQNGEGQRHLFAKAIAMFTPSKVNNAKIVIGEGSIAGAIEFFKTALSAALATHANSSQPAQQVMKLEPRTIKGSFPANPLRSSTVGLSKGAYP